MSNVKITHIERWLLFQEGQLRCAWCSTPLTILSASRDHLIPRGRGGRFGGANIVPACTTCNMERGCQRLDRWIDRMVRRHGALSESTRRMLLLFTVDFHGRARKQHVTADYLLALPVVSDVRLPMEELGVRYRELAQRRQEEIRREVSARRKAHAMAVA